MGLHLVFGLVEVRTMMNTVARQEMAMQIENSHSSKQASCTYDWGPKLLLTSRSSYFVFFSHMAKLLTLEWAFTRDRRLFFTLTVSNEIV